MASNVWNYYQLAGSGSQTYYIYHSDNPNAQITGLKDQPELFKGKNPVEMPSESEVVLKINKTHNASHSSRGGPPDAMPPPRKAVIASVSV